MNNTKKIILTLLFISITVLSISFKITPLNGIISYGDSPFYFNSSSFNWIYLLQENILGQDMSNTMFTLFINLFNQILSSSGLGGNYISYIINYLPVFLLSLMTFVIIIQITKNVLLTIFCSLFVVINNFCLEQFILWPGVYFYNILAILLLVFLSYRIYSLGTICGRDMAIFIALSLFINHPFLLVIYTTYMVSFIIFFYGLNFRKTILTILMVGMGILLLHFFWIFPFIQNLFIHTSQEAYAGNQYAVLDGYRSIATYANLLNYTQYPGSISLKITGIPQIIVNFTMHLIIVCGLFFIKSFKNKRDKGFYIYLLILFLVAFNFALGPNSLLTGNIWLWCLDHVPGFGFFRSFTRWLVLCLIIEILLIGILVKNINIKKYKINLGISFLFIFLIISNRIFFTGNLEGLIGVMNPPNEYFQVNNEIFKKDESLTNIISYPNIPYEAYNWSINRNIDTFPQITYFNLYFFSKPIIYNGFAFNLEKKNILFKNMLGYDANFDESYEKNLSLMNVKYVLVRKDLFNILTKNSEIEGYYKYYDYFIENDNYTLLEDNQYFTLFELNKYTPLFLSKQFLFQKNNPTSYQIDIHSISVKQDISFLQSFHPEWKLYLEPYRPINCSDEGMVYSGTVSGEGNVGIESYHVTECPSENRFYAGGELAKLWQEPIFDNTHKLVYDYANQWTIDPEYIRANYPREYYHENPDGSIDVRMTLYFRPQSYFYLGLIISSITFLGCIGYLVVSRIRRHANHHDS